MKFILGKKIEMTQRFRDDGRLVPVTVIEAGPCRISQVKTAERDGYRAVQLAYAPAKRVKQPQAGHLKDLGSYRVLREFPIEDNEAVERGATVTVTLFKPGDTVQVAAMSKGKGFQGVVKRHGFRGGPATHGDKDQLRRSGSIGATNAQRVFKGTRMAGQMGHERVTVKNLEIIDINEEKNLLFVSGAVPGARNTMVMVSGAGAFVASPTEPVAPASAQKEETKPAQTDATSEQSSQPDPKSTPEPTKQ